MIFQRNISGRQAFDDERLGKDTINILPRDALRAKKHRFAGGSCGRQPANKKLFDNNTK